MASDSDTSSVWSTSSSAVTRTTATTSGSPRCSFRELDPLLKDLGEKKQSFRSSVVSLAAELKEVRSKLSSKEQSVSRESRTRQEAEAKARKLEEEVSVLQKSLDERNMELETWATTAQQYLKELDGVKSKLATAQAIAEESSAAAQSAKFQCVALEKELEAKDNSLKEHKDRVNKLADQLAMLQKELTSRESSQDTLKAEISRIEVEITEALVKAGSGTSDNYHLQSLLEEISPRNLEQMNILLNYKDVEIAKLKEAIEALSSEWRIKNKELELQLEKHRKAHQDLKKRVLKLEFCLQEARGQTRKLQRMGERRDKAIKELQDRLSTNQNNVHKSDNKQKIWERPCFKVAVSMSMLILVVFSKR